MTGKIWTFAVIASCAAGICTGSANVVMDALGSGAGAAVELFLELLGAMALWSGIMEQLAEAGDLERLGAGVCRVMGRMFPGVKDAQAWSAMGVNMAANLFGLGNAATPAGIRAAQLLARQGESGLRALALLLVLNNAGMQLMPTTVIALRSAAGSSAASDIWLPTLVASGAAAVTSVGLLMLLWGREKGCRQN